MAYALNADVALEFKGLVLSTTSVVTAATVDGFIAQAEAEIDGRVGLVYVTPIDSTASPKSFLILKMLSIQLVAERLRPILEVKTGSGDTSQGSGRPKAKGPREVLQDIVDQKVMLSDAVKRSNFDGVQSFSADTGEPMTFQKDQRQW